MRILVVVHGLPPAAQGGSETYADLLARTIRRRHPSDDVLVFTRHADPLVPEYEIRMGSRDGVRVVSVNNTFRHVRSFEESYAHPRIADLFSEVLRRERPEVAHIHHLTCLSTLIPERLKEAGIPSLLTLHDYWLLCHRGQLLDRGRTCCDGPPTCANCIEPAARIPTLPASALPLARAVRRRLPGPAREAVDAAAIRLGGPGTTVDGTPEQHRLAHMRAACRHVTRVHAPSEALRDRFEAAGLLNVRIEPWTFGFEHGDTRSQAPVRGAGGPLRVGFVGSLMVSKAPHVLLDAAARLRAGTVTLDLYGDHADYHGDRSYRERLAPLLAAPHVRAHGAVPHDEMPSRYAGMDVLVLPSVWPENSPLVIREAFLAGVPVVASRIGGIPELVQHEVNGLLFSPGDADALAQGLARLAGEAGLLERLRAGIPPVRTIADDADATRAVYAQLIAAPRRNARSPDRRVAAVVLNYGTPDKTVMAVRALLASDHPLSTVIVVDNADDVACGRALAPLSDQVEYLSTGANLGYGGGMNIGVDRVVAAGATHVLLVNSDVTVPPNAVGALVAALDANTDAGIAGTIVVSRTAPDRVLSAGISYSPGTGRLRQRRSDATQPAARSALGPVDSVDGCFWGLSRQAWERLGPLDEHFFFGLEEVEYCLRAHRAGIRATIVDAVVYHDGGGTLASGSADRLYYGARNELRLVRQSTGPAGGLATLRALNVIALNLAHACKAPPARVPSRLAAVLHGVFDYARGRIGPRR